MCLQDIKIGRRLVGRGGSVAIAAGATEILTGPSAVRLRLAVTSRNLPGTAPRPPGLVQAWDGGAGRTLVGLTDINPSALLRIEDYGSDLKSEIRVFNGSAVVITIEWAEYYDPADLEGL